MYVKNFIRRFVPSDSRNAYGRKKYHNHEFLKTLRYKRQSTRNVFRDIYLNSEWGSSNSESPFYSGAGTHDERIYIPYLEAIKNEICLMQLSHSTAVDIGCGDFFIGNKLSNLFDSYIGVDIVPELVSYLISNYSAPSVRFECLDIIADDLPDADFCFLRQVLQHLSNEQILVILGKMSKYKYIFVTERHPSDSFLKSHNHDKPHGKNTRLTFGSGVFLDKPPFNSGSFSVKLIIELQVDEGHDPSVQDPGVIRTFLIENS